jgi:integrase
LQGGGYLEPSKVTFVQFLRQWLGHIKSRVSPRTHERFTELVEKNIAPLLGAVHLAGLRPAQIAAAYAKALLEGRRDGSGGLSPNTVIYMHRVIKQALAHAVRWEIISRSPADAVDPPKVERAAMSTYDMAQTVELLEAVRDTRLLIPVVLGVLCGMRRGEIIALRWRQVDFINAQLAVVESAEQTGDGVRYEQPKSGRSRTVALSAFVLDELRAHRLRQAEELLKLGARQNEATFVYTREDGQPVQARSLTHAWHQMLAKTALPGSGSKTCDMPMPRTFLLLGYIQRSSERLGHAKVGITLDLYSHVLPGMQADATARVDDALRVALQRRSR